uniref:methionine aminopeptidase 1D, mitochondrial isoform X3 n=1 Tax=Myxine glutinosa TaxID=7769 RepID=UPI00358E2690
MVMALAALRCSLRLTHSRFSLGRPCQKVSFSVVWPAAVQPAGAVPNHIERPHYVGKVDMPDWGDNIQLQGHAALQGLRKAGQLARKILCLVAQTLRVGMTTEKIDDLVHRETIKHGAYPSPLGYLGFPKSVCTSVNNVACHGIPDSRPLEDGDIINVDITVFHKGFHGDTSETFLIGNVDQTGQRLVEAAWKCRDAAIVACAPGQPLCVIGNTISHLALQSGFRVCPQFVGHGIGSFFHGQPDILHQANSGDLKMKEGMVFTIEPILMEGSTEIRILQDGWTAVSMDNLRSAQSEHTIAINKHGAEILTALPKDYQVHSH